MRLAFVLPTYIDTEARRRWAESSLASLSKSRTDGLEQTPLLLIIHKGEMSAQAVARHKFPQFDLQVTAQSPAIHSNDGVYCWSCYQIIEHIPSVTHIALITDDWLYNPRWILELQSLLQRRPAAKAAWVYRSAYEEIHKTLKVEMNGDVMVRSINAGGMSPISEWKEWKLDWRRCPRENGEKGRLSLDLLHPVERPGERWVTSKSYIVNIGMRGVCQRPETYDFAVDFVGLEDTQPLIETVTRPVGAMTARAYQGAGWICATCGFMLFSCDAPFETGSGIRRRVRCPNENCPHFGKQYEIPTSAAVELIPVENS